MPVPYTTSSFLHEGHQLVYDTYGRGDRLVIYLHGLLVDSDMNRGIATALAEHGQQGGPARPARSRP